MSTRSTHGPHLPLSLVLLIVALPGCGGAPSALPSAPATAGSAAAVVDRAVALTGGPALERLERIRLDMMTQWQRTDYSDVPGRDRPSFEVHTDVRDYTIPAWRNTRELGGRTIINVVRDSVAVTSFGDRYRPQSVAYVDERDELFMYTPDRLLLALREAPDLGFAGDTVMGGESFHQIRATLPPGIPVTVAFHAGTGLPSMLRFRQGHPNDFGLVPFGEMAVEVWYSGWRTFGEISIPTQWDVYRAGAPYKRMTVRNAAMDPEFAADSFAIDSELRTAFFAGRGPMHHLPVDSVTAPGPGLLQVHGFGFPAGAVGGEGEWVLLEAGHAALSLQRARAALSARGAGELVAAVVATAAVGNGGVVELARKGMPLYTSAAAEPFVRVILENHGIGDGDVTVVREGRWLGAGGDRLRFEPVDLPDVPGSLLVYSPARQWVYAPDAGTPLDLKIALQRARELGWAVAFVGTPRRLWAPAPTFDSAAPPAPSPAPAG